MEGVFSVTGDSGRVESIATCTAGETEEKCRAPLHIGHICTNGMVTNTVICTFTG